RDARRAGQEVSFTAVLVRATAQLLRRFPRLNQHLFHGLFSKKLVQFDHITCTLIVERHGDDGESILLPVLIRDPDKLSLAEIYREIRRCKLAPLAALPQVAGMERLKRLPTAALKLFSFLVRSSPA